MLPTMAIAYTTIRVVAGQITRHAVRQIGTSTRRHWGSGMLRPFHHARWHSRALGLVMLLGACNGYAPDATALETDKQFNHYARDTWGLDQGLPQVSIQAFAQDRQRYLWIGTMSGLTRFDGVRMTSFNDKAPAHLPGTLIQALRMDASGTLWIGTYRGLARYRDGHFSNVLPQDPQAPLLNIEAITVDTDGTVLVAAQNGVYAVEGERLRLRYHIASGAYALLPHGHQLWVGTRGAVLRLGADSATPLPLPQDMRDAPVQQLLEAQGRVWVGTRNGLLYLHAGSWQRLADDACLTRRAVHALFEDSDGNLWVGLSGSLLRVRNGKVVERNNETSQNAATSAIFEDRERNLWLGSNWNGISRLWNGLTRRYSVPQGLNDPLVWTLARDSDGSMWVGTGSGLSRLRDGHYQQVLRMDQLPTDAPYTLLAEPGQLWIGTRRGIAFYRNGQLSQPRLLAPLHELQISGIVRDHAQRLWFASDDGLFRSDGKHLRRYGIGDGLRDARIRLLHETRDGRLLVGSQAGLYELRGERLVALATPDCALANADITAIHELPGGQWLVGTLSEELWLFDGKRWSMLDETDGLPANAPFFITDDPQGNVWVAGLRGIYRLYLNNLLQHAATPSVALQAEWMITERAQRHGGMRGMCCNGIGNGKGFIEGGTLWLPSRDGVVAMNTTGIVKNPVAPLPVVERLRVLGQWLNPQALPTPLPKQARDLDFEFTAASFQVPESIELRYRLLGYDTRWHSPDDIRQRVATYTNLPGGNYLFEVTARNNSGVWAVAPARLPLRIQPRLQETPYFKLLLGLGELGLVLLTIQLARLHNRRQRETLEQQMRERTKALQEANQRLQEASFTDELTQLRNRRYLSLHISSDIALYRRMADDDQDMASSPACPGMLFALIDIDHFKAINDNSGHHTGDAILQQMAQLLIKLTRKSDHVVRWGGEEFLLVMRSAPHENLTVAAERLCNAIAAHPFVFDHGNQGRVTCSIGMAEFPFVHDPDNQLGWEQLLVLADRALYQAKARGRNGWAAYRPLPGTQAEQVLAALQEPSERMSHHTCLTLVHNNCSDTP
ncbi:ligand-binding sensor domain-containing diguanylate cyclase [Xanthomonas albilineans]|uniref:ligand-binding sensor domain-containing diguanylate cyclase n=1 Tax=Xanthomonas albilineans TaxID=29447 RepID=UPI000ACE8550|nr:ligand-binding sensor domain-containing diguanylate cyclase [Xanthomonas albilineans]